jgi:UDP-N-acetylglucosamine--N-acetylmuramyl-(pentapeptide) pyrophosphoryl-undecaprenol N-acetylglucosamine transferase
MKKKLSDQIFIAAGGTGGHIIPARTLAKELSENDFQVTFLGDEKIKNYLKENDKFSSKIISCAQIKKSPILSLKAAIKINFGVWQSLFLILKKRPKAVFAFGGYATFPILIASVICKTPIILHEQNAHLGKVNRLFAKYASKIAISFEKTDAILPEFQNKIILTGNLVRKEIVEIRNKAYQLPNKEIQAQLDEEARMGYNILLASDFKEQKSKEDFFRILVIGGSGGAEIFSEILPKAFFNLSENIKDKIQVVQQCRANLVEETFAQYCSYNVNIIVDKFFENMSELIENSHLIIARAGSSSIFEFCAAKRPMILVPFAASADNHQDKNAQFLEEKNAAIVIRQKDFTISNISEILRNLIIDEKALNALANNAGEVFKEDAMEKLINLVK